MSQAKCTARWHIHWIHYMKIHATRPSQATPPRIYTNLVLPMWRTHPMVETYPGTYPKLIERCLYEWQRCLRKHFERRLSNRCRIVCPVACLSPQCRCPAEIKVFRKCDGANESGHVKSQINGCRPFFGGFHMPIFFGTSHVHGICVAPSGLFHP